MDIGTVVIETEGFYKGSEFTITGENLGTSPKWGEQSLRAPVVPVAPKRSLGTRLLEGEALPTLSDEEFPTFRELLPRWDGVESVRVLEKSVKHCSVMKQGERCCQNTLSCFLLCTTRAVCGRCIRRPMQL